jgi:hypothetical protein
LLIGATWGEYFGTKDDFLSAGAQLEFVLELNSYLLVVSKNSAVGKFRTDNPKKFLMYRPDFWATRLALVAPIAERIYDTLVGRAGFPMELALEPEVTKAIFAGMTAQQRSLFFGEFLNDLRRAQTEYAFSMGNLSYQYAWTDRLKVPVDEYLESTKPKA